MLTVQDYLDFLEDKHGRRYYVAMQPITKLNPTHAYTIASWRKAMDSVLLGDFIEANDGKVDGKNVPIITYKPYVESKK